MKFSDLTKEAIEKLPDEEILSLHHRAHELSAGDFCENAKRAHDGLLVMEMERRGITHDSVLECEAKKERGLYLVEPHGKLIAKGEKKAIAKSRRFDLEGEWILVSGDYAWGNMTLGEPEEIGLEEFDKRFSEHCVSPEERMKWWPGYKTLWLYPILSVGPYDPPKKVIVPPGVQTVMRDVEFAEKQQTRAEIVLDKLADLPDKFVWIPDFVSVTGSTLYAAEDREPGDIDVVLRAERDGDGYAVRTPVDASFAIKLERVLREALGDKRVQYVPNTYGPNWTHCGLYDLCLVKREPLELIAMGEREPEFAAMEYKARTLTQSTLDHKLRGASDEIKKQALETWKEDKVVPGRMVLSLKPMRPAPAGERQTVDQFYKYIEENLEYPLYISPKRDGATNYLHGDGKQVWIFSDDGEDNTDRLPHIVETLKKNFKDKSFVFGAEVEQWRDRNHFPREAAIGAVKKGEDEDLAINIFRVIYWDGKDIHKLPFEETWKIAQTLPVDTKKDGALNPQKDGPINLVPHYKVNTHTELKEKLESVAYKPGVEGVIVKRADGDFPLDGEPGSTSPTEVKFHKSFGFSAETVGKEETKTKGVFVYTYKLDDEEIGKTFGSALDAPIHSVLGLEGEQLNVERNEDGETVAVTVWAPEVMGKAEGKPDSLKAVIERARKHGVLREKVQKADGTIEYLPNESGDPATANKASEADYPDESKKLRYVCQIHFRGRSAHLDLRVEFKRGDQHYLKGWTVAIQQPEAIKEPVLTEADAKRAVANPDLWKLDLKTGIIKPRQIRGGVVRRGDLRAFPKAAEIPADWLDVSGVTEKPDPGEPVPVGATREYPGVFLIVSKGEVEWGAVKPWFSEYWLNDDWEGRWAFRLVKREGQKHYTPETGEDMKSFDLAAMEKEFWTSLEEGSKADTLPPGVAEEDAREGSYFVLMQPLEQQGYVLSKEAIEESWLPPRGISALPKKVRSAIPESLRFWGQDHKQALESRRKLAEEYEELGGPDLGKKQATVKFVLTRRDWRGQEVIRFGSSTVVHDLWVDGWRLTLSGDPLKDDEAAGQPADPDDKVKGTDGKAYDVLSMEVGKTVDVKPHTEFNPTKETPCQLEVLDKGDAQELGVDKSHRKYQFKGKELKGAWFFHAEDEEKPEGFWLMSRSEGPKTKEADMKEITVLVEDELQESDKAQSTVCVCPSCSKEYIGDKPCAEIKCEECGVPLAEKEAVGVQTERSLVSAVTDSLGQQVKDNIAISDKAVLLLDDESRTVEEFPLEEYDSVRCATEAAEKVLTELVGEKVGRRIQGGKLQAIKDIKDKIVQAVERLVKEVIGWGDYSDGDELGWLSSEEGQKALACAYERGSAGFAFKGKDGQTWWFQFTTNAFQDKQKEIFSTKSLEECVARHKEKETKGEFWYRHIPGSKFGNVQWEAMIGRFLGQTGPFDSTDVGAAFKEFFLTNPYGHPEIAPDGWGTSHKYYFNRSDKEAGVYEWLEITESSVLPAHVASNPWNVVPTDNLKEVIQMSEKMSDQEKKDLEIIGGSKLVEMVEKLGVNQTKELEGQVDYKALDVIKELKAVVKGIEDERLKKRLSDVIAKLESYPKPKAKEDEGKTDESEKGGLTTYLANELQAVAKEVGGDAGKKILRIAEALNSYAYPKPANAEYGYPKPGIKAEGEDPPVQAGEKQVEPITREEVFTAMKSLVEMVRTEVAQAVKSATEEAVGPIASALKEMQKTDAEKAASLVQNTPAASLDAMLKGMFGDETAKVDKRTSFAKQGPVETPPETGKGSITGVPFVDMFITGADQRRGGSQ